MTLYLVWCLAVLSAVRSTWTMSKKEPKVYKCFICFQKLNSHQNYLRHVETHNTFSYGWVFDRKDCEAAFQRLRKDDFQHQVPYTRSTR